MKRPKLISGMVLALIVMLIAGAWLLAYAFQPAPKLHSPARCAVFMKGTQKPIYLANISDRFANALYARHGGHTSAGFTLLEDNVPDTQIGRVVFTIHCEKFVYPIVRVPVPQEGGVRYIWYGPQNDMRAQTNTENTLLLWIGYRLGMGCPDVLRK